MSTLECPHLAWIKERKLTKREKGYNMKCAGVLRRKLKQSSFRLVPRTPTLIGVGQCLSGWPLTAIQVFVVLSRGSFRETGTHGGFQLQVSLEFHPLTGQQSVPGSLCIVQSPGVCFFVSRLKAHSQLSCPDFLGFATPCY